MKHVNGITLERLLECAVVVSWADLLQGDNRGSIHVDYCFRANGSVDTLTFWSSKDRGHWHRLCEYRMALDEQHRLRFEHGYEIAELASNLEVIMQHQDAFLPAVNHGRNGLLQVHTPTRDETNMAHAVIAEAHLQVDPMLSAQR